MGVTFGPKNIKPGNNGIIFDNRTKNWQETLRNSVFLRCFEKKAAIKGHEKRVEKMKIGRK